MQTFKSLTSIAIPLMLDNVDTDMIIPAQFLTKVGKDGYGEHLFERLKSQNPAFVFNDPRYQGAEILISLANFGCGSSREHAVWTLMQAGIKVVIAESYSDIFYNNATKNGLLAITVDRKIIQLLIDLAKAQQQMTVDLAAQTIHARDAHITFEYDPFRKECLLKGQDDLDYLLEATR